MTGILVRSLGLLLAAPLAAQVYTIRSVAGGGLPVNIPATSAALGATGGVALDSNGNVYFSAPGLNLVLCVDASTRQLSVVAGTGTPGFSGDNGPAASAQLNQPNGLAFDSSGSLYIADTGNHTVREVSKGIISTVMVTITGSSAPTPVSVYYLSSVAVDPAGTLDVLDSYAGVVSKIANGAMSVVVGVGGGGPVLGDNGPAAKARLNSPSGIAFDAAGNLYIADTGDCRIREVSGGVITTVAGTTCGFSGDNGPATSAQLKAPSNIALDAAGNLYIADAGNCRVRKVSSGVIATLAGTAACGFSGDNGPATSAALDDPDGLAADPAGDVYFADVRNNRIREVSAGVIATIAGGGTFNGDGGPPLAAILNQPAGVALDAAGNLYLADTSSNRIRGVSHGVIATIAGTGVPGFAGDNGPAVDAELSQPSSLAFDRSGNLYIADTGNNLVRMVSNGRITTFAGGGSSLGDGGPAVNAMLGGPTGLAFDTQGNLYIADHGLGRVRKVSGGVISTVAGPTLPNYPPLAPQSVGRLNPYDVAVDAMGNLYVSDDLNGPVLKFPNGSGTPIVEAPFVSPHGIAVDPSGNLFIANWGGGRILEAANGILTVIAGGGNTGIGDNGPALLAQLSFPNALVLDPSGNIYVADAGDSRIRLLTSNASTCSYSLSPATLQVPAAGGNVALGIVTGPSCLWVLTGLPPGVTYSGPPSGAGPVTVTLAVAPNASPTAQSLVISVGGAIATINQGPAVPAINAGGIVSAASSSPAVSPGSIASVYGTFFLNMSLVATTLPLPANLDGLSLQLGSTAAPLFYVSYSQLNIQIPWELAGSTQSSAILTVGGIASPAQSITVTAYAPGLFATNGAGQGAILDASYKLVDASNPAHAGSTVLLYCTGLGPVTHQPATGAASPFNPIAATTATPSVSIGGAPATVAFSGLAPGLVGLYQINAIIPAASPKGNAVPVSIAIGGASSNTVTLAIQ